MDAVAKMKDSTTHASIRGHQYVCAILVCRHHVLPFGLRLYVKQAACPALGLPCRKTTELAAPLMRECKAPPGVNVVVLCDAYSLCTTVVKACREQHCHVASTLKSHRRLFKRGWKLTAGRYGRHRCRRRRTDTLALSTPDGQVHSRFVAAGWLPVSTLGPLHVVFSGKGPANTRLGLVTDAPTLSAPEIIRTYDKRGTIAHWIQDTQQLLGLGHDQHRSSWAAVTHRPLVCFASALLTHRRLERHGAQGRRRRATAADLSTAIAQDQLRGLLWGDLIIYLQEKPPRPSVIAALARLRVA
jgi:hypothetical protein